MGSHRITVRLDDGIHSLLTERCRQAQIDISFVVRQALQAAMKGDPEHPVPGAHQGGIVPPQEIFARVGPYLAWGRGDLRDEVRRQFIELLSASWACARLFPRFEVRNTRTGFFEEPEFRAVLEHLPEEVKPVAEFMYLTGWRKQEVLTLGWRQVDFNAGVVRLEPGTTKTDEGRTFPFSIFPAMKALLERQRARTDALQQATDQIIPWVFHRDGKPIRSFRKAWDNAIKEAGIPRRIPHDFRRTAVRNLERAGVPRSVAMKLTGHQTESVYRRYAIVSERDLSEGVAKLAALHTGQEKGPVERKVIEGHFEASRKAPAKQGTSGN